MPTKNPQSLDHDRQEQIKRLTRSRDHYRELFQSAPVAYLTVDNDLTVLEANLSAEALLQIARSYLIGAKLSEYVDTDHRKDLSRHVQNTLNSNRRQNCRLKFVRTDGTTIVLRLESVAAANGTGGNLTCRSAMIDITGQFNTELRLQQMHEQLDLAARAAGLGVWNFDVASGASIWNEQLYRLLGEEPRDAPEDGERFFDFIHPEDRTGIIKNIQSVLESRQDHIKEEFRVVRADGDIKWLASRGRIYRDSDGKVVHISGINYDITDRKQVEESVRLAQVQLVNQLSETEHINEELSQYAYAVSHDLKGPLRAIRNYADFLYDDLADRLTGDQKSYIEGLKTAVEQAYKLIDDLLNFSRIGREPLEIQAADVRTVVSEIQSMLNLPPEVEINVEPKWPHFSADLTLFKQILQNLITNGIKFNRSERKRIEIGWQPATGDSIDIFVRDNGIGIDPQYQEQIFRIFQRLHTQSDYEGTGIGLAIVQKAAYKLGGIARMESEPGKGSTFYVRLPREPENSGSKDSSMQGAQ